MSFGKIRKSLWISAWILGVLTPGSAYSESSGDPDKDPNYFKKKSQEVRNDAMDLQYWMSRYGDDVKDKAKVQSLIDYMNDFSAKYDQIAAALDERTRKFIEHQERTKLYETERARLDLLIKTDPSVSKPVSKKASEKTSEIKKAASPASTPAPVASSTPEPEPTPGFELDGSGIEQELKFNGKKKKAK